MMSEQDLDEIVQITVEELGQTDQTGKNPKNKNNTNHH